MKYILLIACLLCSTAMAQSIKLSPSKDTKFMPIVLEGIDSIKPTDTTFTQSGNRVFKEVTTVYSIKDQKPYTIKYKTVWNDVKGHWDFYSMVVLTEPESKYSGTTGILTTPYFR